MNRVRIFMLALSFHIGQQVLNIKAIMSSEFDAAFLCMTNHQYILEISLTSICHCKGDPSQTNLVHSHIGNICSAVSFWMPQRGQTPSWTILSLLRCCLCKLAILLCINAYCISHSPCNLFDLNSRPNYKFWNIEAQDLNMLNVVADILGQLAFI